VQDVFKHDALFSKFAVSTASSSPLRLFSSELWDSDLFESHLGVPPSDPVMIFPKQPASLLYKIVRKKGSEVGSKAKKTMYLKLRYSILLEEAERLVEHTLKQSLEETGFREYSKLVVSCVLARFRDGLTDHELERCALLGEVRTSFMSNIKWAKYFAGLGKTGTQDIAPALVSHIQAWQKEHNTLQLTQPDPSTSDLTRSILIPVDIPSITIVHTADIRLDEGGSPSILADPEGGSPAVCINQLVPATLHLKWTRVWDTGNPDIASTAPLTPAVAGPSPSFTDDLEFSYEVTAPSDTWLVGGRRKGHFVIPAAVASGGDMEGLSSTPDTEADIALLLVPLREGWLPYPSVEIREIMGGPSLVAAVAPAHGDPEVQSPGYGQCETDFRNIGETVRVIADRSKVTLSLDASGPGGGPLVLESERLRLGGSFVA
jgi:hypothetical protein